MADIIFKNPCDLEPEHLNCNIFSCYDYDGLSLQELLCQFYTKINECVDLSQQTFKLADWLVKEGLAQKVAETLEKWLKDGTLQQVLGEEIMKRVRYYNSYAKMIADISKIEPNASIVTSGYETPNDGGGAEYVKTSSGIELVPHDSINVLQFGIKSNTGIDVTQKINEMIKICADKKVKTINFNSGVYDVARSEDTKVCIALKSNLSINMKDDTIIKIKTNDKTHYDIFNLDNIHDVEINGGVIEGDKGRHTGSTGEWGHGIALYNSQNIRINNVVCKKCWGDGIYIGVNSAEQSCKNILINNVLCDDNRRQGLSVISVDGLKVLNSEFDRTDGANPKSGIDFEPNDSKNILKNILIDNVTTLNNEGPGILIYLSNLDQTSQPVDITVNNHKSVSDKATFQTFNKNQVKGSIVLNNAYYTIKHYNAMLLTNVVDGINITINNPTFEVAKTHPNKESMILINRANSTPIVGNISINSPKIIIPEEKRKDGLKFLIEFYNSSDIIDREFKLKNVYITNPIVIGDVSKMDGYYGCPDAKIHDYNTNINITDSGKAFSQVDRQTLSMALGVNTFYTFKAGGSHREVYGLDKCFPNTEITIYSLKENNYYHLMIRAVDIDGSPSYELNSGKSVTLKCLGGNRWCTI